MKALNIPFQMRYGSPVCYEKWLCGSPKCEAPLHEASSAKKYALKIAICLKKFKKFKSADSPDIPLSDEV